MAITYLIGWAQLDLWYYGSSSKNSTLWRSYFTSSELVALMRTSAGEPDIVRIHKRFDTFPEAVAHETKFLTRVGAAQSARWLNLTNGNERWYNTPESMEKMVSSKRANGTLKHTLEAKAKMSATRRRIVSQPGYVCPNTGKKRSEEFKRNRSEKYTKFYATEKGKKIARDRVAHRIGLPTWNSGKELTPEQKKNMKGRAKPHSDEAIEKMRIKAFEREERKRQMKMAAEAAILNIITN